MSGGEAWIQGERTWLANRELTGSDENIGSQGLLRSLEASTLDVDGVPCSFSCPERWQMANCQSKEGCCTRFSLLLVATPGFSIEILQMTWEAVTDS